MDSIDLGSGHSFRWVTGDAEHFPTDDERLKDWRGEKGLNLVGVIEAHQRPDGTPCEALVSFVAGRSETDRETWELHSLDPLHIDPSVHCVPEKGGCGAHGHIHNGRWQPA